MKLGKLPAREGAVSFRFAQYANAVKLPTPPRTFGHEAAVGPSWGMLGNDDYGCCVPAGAAHETMLWGHEGGKVPSFTPDNVLADYAAVTGFDPSKPDTDQGTDMSAFAAFRRKTGVVDATDQRHKIAAYLALEPGNLTELYQAAWLFGAVGIGIEFPGSAMAQFDAGKPWTVVRGASIEGGHYVPLVARRQYLEVVTWGKVQRVSTTFLGHYCDEALAYVSAEALTAGKSPEGFDYATLLADLAKLPHAG